MRISMFVLFCLSVFVVACESDKPKDSVDIVSEPTPVPTTEPDLAAPIADTAAAVLSRSSSKEAKPSVVAVGKPSTNVQPNTTLAQKPKANVPSKLPKMAAPPFTIQSATSQMRFPGMEGAPISTIYKAALHIDWGDRVVFDSVWVNEKAYKIQVNSSNAACTVGDNVEISFTEITYRPDSGRRRNGAPETPKLAPQSPPIPYKGVALLSYTLEGKKAYYVLREVTELERIYMP